MQQETSQPLSEMHRIELANEVLSGMRITEASDHNDVDVETHQSSTEAELFGENDPVVFEADIPFNAKLLVELGLWPEGERAADNLMVTMQVRRKFETSRGKRITEGDSFDRLHETLILSTKGTAERDANDMPTGPAGGMEIRVGYAFNRSGEDEYGRVDFNGALVRLVNPAIPGDKANFADNIIEKIDLEGKDGSYDVAFQRMQRYLEKAIGKRETADALQLDSYGDHDTNERRIRSVIRDNANKLINDHLNGEIDLNAPVNSRLDQAQKVSLNQLYGIPMELGGFFTAASTSLQQDAKRSIAQMMFVLADQTALGYYKRIKAEKPEALIRMMPRDIMRNIFAGFFAEMVEASMRNYDPSLGAESVTWFDAMAAQVDEDEDLAMMGMINFEDEEEEASDVIVIDTIERTTRNQPNVSGSTVGRLLQSMNDRVYAAFTNRQMRANDLLRVIASADISNTQDILAALKVDISTYEEIMNGKPLDANTSFDRFDPHHLGQKLMFGLNILNYAISTGQKHKVIGTMPYASGLGVIDDYVRMANNIASNFGQSPYIYTRPDVSRGNYGMTELDNQVFAQLSERGYVIPGGMDIIRQLPTPKQIVEISSQIGDQLESGKIDAQFNLLPPPEEDNSEDE